MTVQSGPGSYSSHAQPAPSPDVHTWALVHPSLIEMFEVFSVLFAPQKNSMNFRNSLNSAVLPAIPHVGMFLSDLTFIEDGNKTVVAGKKGSEKQINVMKLRKVAGIIERGRFSVGDGGREETGP